MWQKKIMKNVAKKKQEEREECESETWKWR